MEKDELKIGIEKSDHSVLFVKRLLKIIALLSCIAFCIVGIIFWASAQETKYLSGIGEYTETNGLFVFLGFVFSIGGTMLSILGYKVAVAILWVAYDIKLIRNKLYDMPTTDYLKKFVDNDSGNTSSSV